MKLLDLYYRAFRSLRKHTKDDHHSQKLRKVIAHSSPKNEVFSTTRFDCEIQVDWIENIEAGLVFVEKAIQENRQFIRTEGEVVPIEKVKKVSKTSFEHLARHGNFITRAPKTEQDDIVPEKLYIVEKLSDYLVYENRFLYMLLIYLRDFIQMRLDKIREKTTTFHSQMEMDKEIKANQQHIEYKLNFKEEYFNAPFLSDRFEEIPLVKRIENIFEMSTSFLSTPLMREVAKAPMIKPPVVKTNVLLMNQNFRGCLRLYDYIMAYNTDGYRFIEVKKVAQPLPKEMSDEIAETIQLSSFLGIQEGLEIRGVLEDRYTTTERLQAEHENKKIREDIARLKKRMIEMQEDPAEYILRLEKRNAALEKESYQLSQALEKNRLLQEKIDAMEVEKNEFLEKIQLLMSQLEQKNQFIQQLNQKYFDDMTYAEEVHQHEIKALKEKHRLEIVALIQQHEQFVLELKAAHQAEKEALISKYETQLRDMMERYETKLKDTIASYELKLHETISTYESKLEETITHYETKLSDTIAQYEQQIQETKESYEAQLQDTIQTFETKVASLIAAYDEKIEVLIGQYNRKLESTIQEYQTKLQEAETRRQNEIAVLDATIVKRIDQIHELESTIDQMIADIKESEKEHASQMNEMWQKNQRLEDEKKFANAQFLAFKAQRGLLSDEDDFTSKDQFQRLESEMQAYRKLFKEQWKKAKAQIREKAKKEMFGEVQETSKEEQTVETDQEQDELKS